MDYSNKWPYMDTWEQPPLVFKLADVAFFFFWFCSWLLYPYIGFHYNSQKFDVIEGKKAYPHLC